MQLPFGEWLPDQPDHLNPGATVATNVYHAQTSYKPVKGLVAYSGASNVTQNAKGAGSFTQYLRLLVQKTIFIN